MHSGLVGVTLPLIHHSYFSEILAGIGEAFYEHEIPMVLCPTLHEHDREVTLLQRLRHGTTDGAILILPEESHDELVALQEQGYPFVIVDPRLAPDERAPTVSASHLSGAREATEHLLRLGHRRIAAITGPHGWIATEERLLRNELKAVVATSALGMGYDKADLGFVVHYQAPGSVVSYYQQVGRAGRGEALVEPTRRRGDRAPVKAGVAVRGGLTVDQPGDRG
jgi:DNA-binding LacI/PurR family transcriptional regulator